MISVPDTRLGENLCAFIIAQEGVILMQNDMVENFAEMFPTAEGLGITPAYFLFMTMFPTVNSKVDRLVLRQMAIDSLGL